MLLVSYILLYTVLYVCACVSIYQQLIDATSAGECYESAIDSVSPCREGYWLLWVDYIKYCLTKLTSLKVCL